MKHLELHRFKKAIGAITFGIFFPNENKRLNQSHGIGKQLDLVLVTPGNQTNTVGYLRILTGWTVKKATDFFKQGHYPKVVIYDVKLEMETSQGSVEEVIAKATDKEVIFKIY